MLKRISHTFIHVLDQDEALEFYVGKLGMVVHTDADMGVMRFLTVNVPDQPGRRARADAARARRRTTTRPPRRSASCVTKGAAGGGLIFETDDCRATYERLRAAGVEFTQEPDRALLRHRLRAPRSRSAIRIRITQPADGPIVGTDGGPAPRASLNELCRRSDPLGRLVAFAHAMQSRGRREPLGDAYDLGAE